jgi:hypothetical protein
MGSVPVFPKDPYGGAYGPAAQHTTAVDELIGSAYDVVRYVAENLEYIKHVSYHLKEIYRVFQSIEGIDAIYARIGDFDQLILYLDQVIIVAENIGDINLVAGEIEAIGAIGDSLPQLLEIYNNIDAILEHGPSAVIVSPTPPVGDLLQGHLWWNSSNGDLYTWFIDVNSAAWVQVNTTGEPGSSLMLSPLMFEAVGDGVTNDDIAVQECVANAFNTGQDIYWEPGTYLTTVNIPNLHAVRHHGPGIIKRGTDVFTIEPKDTDTNRIYVSASGADSNDGLTATQPIRTLSKAKAILVDTQANQRGGTWEIKFAAGTYADSTNFPDLPIFRNAIRFIGTGTSRTPQTVFDGAAAVYKTAGMYFQNRTNVYLQYLKFIDFTIGYGVLAEHNCQIELDDCDAVNCNLGFANGYSSFIRTTRCLAQNCATGFSTSSNSQASFAPKTDLIADSNRAYACGYGFVATRMSYGHIDYNEIEDCTFAGMRVEINSRVAALGNNFKRNTLAVRCWTSGYISRDTANPNIFNQADAINRNLEVYEFRGSSGIVNDHGQLGTMNVSLHHSATPVTVTGTASVTQVGGNLYTISAGWFSDASKRVRFRAWGTVTTPVDGTISLQLKLASTALTTLSIPISVTAQAWTLDAVKMIFIGRHEMA